jgi:hypothetical protein
MSRKKEILPPITIPYNNKAIGSGQYIFAPHFLDIRV